MTNRALTGESHSPFKTLQIRATGHSRSPKVTPFDSLHMVSYRPILTVSLKCSFRDVVIYWSKVSEKNLPHSHLIHSLGVTLCVVFKDSYTLPESRIMGISDCVHFMNLLPLCYAKYWSVADLRTDGHVSLLQRPRDA